MHLDRGWKSTLISMSSEWTISKMDIAGIFWVEVVCGLPILAIANALNKSHEERALISGSWIVACSQDDQLKNREFKTPDCSITCKAASAFGQDSEERVCRGGWPEFRFLNAAYSKGNTPFEPQRRESPIPGTLLGWRTHATVLIIIEVLRLSTKGTSRSYGNDPFTTHCTWSFSQ